MISTLYNYEYSYMGIIMHASIQELRLHTKEFLDIASRGEEVIVTYRGKDYVKLIPIAPFTNLDTSNNPAFGLWKDNANVDNVEEFVNQLRSARHHDFD